MAEEKQENQKTVVSFVVGLLIGGLLVWAFSGPATEEVPTKNANTPDVEEVMEEEEMNNEESNAAVTPETPRPTLSVGEGNIVVPNQNAGSSVTLTSATYPVSEGWVGVRDYQNNRLAGLLGVVRFSEEQGLVPTEIVLQRPTMAGNEYAVVVFTENGDRQFNIAEDVQLDSVFSTFTVQ